MRDAIDALEIFEVMLPSSLLHFSVHYLSRRIAVLSDHHFDNVSMHVPHPAYFLMMQHVRDVTDPEHPYTLEQLKVVSEDAITVKDKEGIVRSARLEICFFSDKMWQTILL